MSNNKELHIYKEFEDKIKQGELSARDIKNFMEDKNVSSLIFQDRVTIH